MGKLGPQLTNPVAIRTPHRPAEGPPGAGDRPGGRGHHGVAAAASPPTSPASYAVIAACTRFFAPSRVRIVLTCAFTVPSTTNIFAAMSALDSPEPSSVSTSRSRGVSSGDLRTRRGGPGQPAAGQPRDHPLRHLRREERGPVGDGVDAGQQLARVARLQQEPARAEPERALDVLVLAERGQHDDAGRGQQPPDLGGRAQAVQPGHPDVEQHDVRVRGEGLGDRRTPVGGFGDDLDPRVRAEDRRHPRPHQRLVVGQHDPDHDPPSANQSLDTSLPSAKHSR